MKFSLTAVILPLMAAMVVVFTILWKLLDGWISTLVFSCYKIMTLLFVFIARWTVRFLTFGGAGWLHKRRIEYQLAK